MSWRVSNVPRLRNCLCVLLLYIFAGSTVAQSSNKGIAPSGLEWEESGRTLWGAPNWFISTQKERKYLHSIDEEGNVWIKTQGRAYIETYRPSGGGDEE